MDSSGTSRHAPTSPHPRGDKETPSVSPLFPLLLLETMRDRDRPEEVLEDEDISLSMPRRLGLSEVVRVQIRRFEEEVRHRRPQISSQVEDLCRLVIRRPDAEEIFTDAGRRVAERYWHEKGGALRRVVRFLPRALALRTAQRAARRMFRDLVGPTRFSVTRRPVQLRIDQALTVRADPGGAACAFYAGAFVGLLELYTGRRYRVLHPLCGTRKPEAACEWEVEIAS